MNSMKKHWTGCAESLVAQERLFFKLTDVEKLGHMDSTGTVWKELRVLILTGQKMSALVACKSYSGRISMTIYNTLTSQ